MINLEERHYAIIKAILAKYPYTFYAFGSRVKGKARRFSDLDICFFEPIPSNIVSHIREDFEESNLPFEVDIVNWNTSSEQFRRSIFPDLYYLQGDQAIKEKLKLA